VHDDASFVDVWRILMEVDSVHGR